MDKTAMLLAALKAMMDNEPHQPRPISDYTISKSQFSAGLQCPKRLWLQKHGKEQGIVGEVVALGIKQQGTSVGLIAQKEFPSGVLVDIPNTRFAEAVTETARLIADPDVLVIFEAAFEKDNLRARADILVRVDDRWEAITLPDKEADHLLGEVKFSTKVKDYHIDDVSFQAHVLESAGVKIGAAVVIHLNPEYTLDGTLPLFKTERIERRPEGWVREQANDQLRTLHQPVSPDVIVGRQCTDPHPCEFSAHCHAKLRVDDLAYTPISPKWDIVNRLRKSGITSICDIDLHGNFTDLQRKNILGAQDALQVNGIVIRKPEFQQELSQIPLPLAFMDFETVGFAIPRWSGMKPWQPMQIQFSVHQLSLDGIEHFEFLAEADGTDPRPEFVRHLLAAVKSAAKIAVWSPYEKTQLNKLAEAFPEYAEQLHAVAAKLWDLCEVFKRNIYHPGFKGSFSIKKVSPVLVSDGYEGLEISCGEDVLPAWERLCDLDISADEKRELRQSLLDYCKQDTQVMVKLLTAVSPRPPTATS